MKLSQFIDEIEMISPKNLSESYDNVGLSIGDKNENIQKVLVALDCTMDVIKEAEQIGAQLIYTHHPLLFLKPKSITTDTLQGRKIIELIKNNINVYSAHTNLDSVAGGVNDSIMHILGFDKFSIIDASPIDKNAGIGRIVEIEETPLKCIIDNVKEKLNIETIRYSGCLEARIKKIAVINGSGQDYFEAAANMNADLIITGDTTYHYVSDYSEMGICIIDAGHFDTEWLSFLETSKHLLERISKIDNTVEFVVSTSTRNPYNYI